ncbi:hypothetical protein BSL78_04256 [Apostichopus japonicus]|uniref:C-type lectin domain-containing protein n=1 Tax=Stichopus japonicus TaxID=307972 RepID=A0A2G8LF00_STIJA|nr:hypothetical protein BSL78_04256 [Apostichopus japonicus]
MTDMLNMGIRGVELDNWFCLGRMRLAHLAENFRMNCQDDDKLFTDGIKEIADWLNIESNAQEIIRIYLNEKSDQGYDQLVNGPINTYLGGRVLTPRDLNETYHGTWPTLRQMKKDGKNVVIATASSGDTPDKVFTHGDLFIHKIYWTDRPIKEFTPYPEFLDYDGPTRVGVITDLSDMMKCRIEFPACDHVNPELIKTAVYTWAESEPSVPLTRNSCVMISSEDNRWYVEGCEEEMHYACQNANDPNDWIMSESRGPYTITEIVCPPSYKFSVPHNGYRHQKLIEAANGTSVWINYSPWLPGYDDPGQEALTTEDPSDATDMQLSIMVRLLFAVILATTLITY